MRRVSTERAGSSEISFATSLKETFSSAARAMSLTATGEKAGRRFRSWLSTAPAGVPTVDTDPTPTLSPNRTRILEFLGSQGAPRTRFREPVRASEERLRLRPSGDRAARPGPGEPPGFADA